MKDRWMRAYVFSLIRDVVVIGIFAMIAVEFGKWWIVLFSILFLRSLGIAGEDI